jgi:hypothetical protein
MYLLDCDRGIVYVKDFLGLSSYAPGPGLSVD